ncbi:MAG: peptidylprolyl isomerase [Planctomycetota bacterium]
MQITKNAVASIEYTLKNDDGEVIDTSTGRAPLAYVHGKGSLVPGLESQLEGKAPGDKLEVRVAPEEGYGPRHEAMVQTVAREQLPPEPEPQTGMQFQAQTEQGPLVLTVVDVAEDKVTLDGNHPLAGMALNFEVNVVDVREATPEELEHGHVHGPGGHQH